MIAYKVVLNSGRKSVFAKGRYKMEYHPFVPVYTVPGTIGLLCFKRKDQAEEFLRLSRHLHPYKNLIRIVKVWGRGAMKSPLYVASYQDEWSLSDWYDSYYVTDVTENMNPPHGTIAFQCVTAIE